jgi:hypothetical protein
VPVETETFQGLLHGFVRATEFVGQSRAAMAKAVTFLQRVA